jgi:hypothetical protein
LAKGKGLLALWVQRQAAVGAFEDAFVFSALIITIGIVPALLIRNIRLPMPSKPVAPAE